MSTAGPTYGPLAGGYVPFGAPLLGPQLALPSSETRQAMAGTDGLLPDLITALHALRSIALQNGCNFQVVSGLRSRADQQRLWDARASNPNPVAQPGTSLHEVGAAADLAITVYPGFSSPGAALAFLGGVLAPRVGLVWSAGDPVHFALPITYAAAAAKRGGAQPLPAVLVTDQAPGDGMPWGLLLIFAALAAVALRGSRVG